MTALAAILIRAHADSQPVEKVNRDGILGPVSRAAVNITILNMARGMFAADLITHEDILEIIKVTKTP